MTREEAIGAIKSNYRGLQVRLTDADLQEIAESDISIYVALGMLKLDEPKPIDLVAHLTGHCRLPRMHGGDCEKMSKEEAERIVDVVNSAGLRIVEK